MAREAPTHLVVGQVTKPHGIKGEVFVRPLTNHPGEIFSSGVDLVPAREGSAEPDHRRPRLTIETVRPFRDGFLVRFRNVPDRNVAETLRRTELLAPLDALAPREDGEIFYHELPGMRVEDTSGLDLGRVLEVFEVEPSVLLEVQTRRGRILVPFVPEVVVDVSLEDRRLVVDPPEGLLEL